MVFKLDPQAAPVSPAGNYAQLGQMRYQQEMARAGMLGAVKEWTDKRVRQVDALERIDREYGLRSQYAKEQRDGDLRAQAMKAALKQREEQLQRENAARAKEYLARKLSDTKTSPIRELGIRTADVFPSLAGLSDHDLREKTRLQMPGAEDSLITRAANGLTAKSRARYMDVELANPVMNEMIREFGIDATELAFESYKTLPTTRQEAMDAEAMRLQRAHSWLAPKSQPAADLGAAILGAMQQQEAMENVVGATGAADIDVRSGEGSVNPILSPQPQPAPDQQPAANEVPMSELGAGFTPAMPKVSRGNLSQAEFAEVLTTKPEAWTDTGLSSGVWNKLTGGAPLAETLGLGGGAKGVARQLLEQGGGLTIQPVVARDPQTGKHLLAGVELVQPGSSRLRPEMIESLERELNKRPQLAALAGYMIQPGADFAQLQELGQSLVHVELRPRPAGGPNRPKTNQEQDAGSDLEDEFDALSSYWQD